MTGHDWSFDWSQSFWPVTEMSPVSLTLETLLLRAFRRTRVRTCDFELGADSNKEWSGVKGKLLADPCVKVVEINATGCDSADGRHSRAPIGIGYL